MTKPAAVAGMAALVVAMTAQGASSDVELEPIKPNLRDLPSLQRGMTLYVNYCLGCHSLKFQRYERTADDLGIPHHIVTGNMLFPGRARPAGMDGAAIGDLMRTAMPQERAKEWFGKPPPDLTMVDRVRGTAWVYSMLKGFYVDPGRPFGFNNRVYENIGMPHVLAGLQGVPRLVAERPKALDLLDGIDEVVQKDADGEYLLAASAEDDVAEVTDRLIRDELTALEVDVGTGSMTADEFDQAAYDIANFLHYVGDPGRLERHRLGVWVLVFLAGLFVLATLLNREYRKDVH